MTNVLLLLDEFPIGTKPDPSRIWSIRVKESLDSEPQAWISAIARVGKLSDGQAWILLGWIEVAASEIVRKRSSDILETAAFAMVLVLQSSLDTRDCSIVAALLRRASGLADLDFTAAVTEGCNRAGELGREARELLEHSARTLPSTHVESGVGDTFFFTRVPPEFDVYELERWLKGDGP
jgi:hypothetical protein